MKYRYVDVYYSRINHFGETTAERIQNMGAFSFEKWLEESPHAVQNLSVERGFHFGGVINQKKDRPEEKIMILHVSNDTPIVVGDVLNWPTEDGTLEKWILFQKEKKVNGTYQTFFITRCNYLLKWIDSLGHRQQSWAHVVSSVDNMIKGNYRTWNALITPQPNKYMEAIMPRYNIDRATNFIVEDESWSLVEYDYSSVPGVIYLSLTENKVNQIYDDLDENIADLDREAQYELLVPTETQIFAVGDIITPSYSLTKNGIPCDYATEVGPVNKKVAKVVRGALTAVGEGETDLIVKLKDFPLIQKTIHIVVSDTTKGFSAYIEGAALIKLDYAGNDCWNNVYELKGTEPIDGKVRYRIEGDTSLASLLIDAEITEHQDATGDYPFNYNTQCIVRANNKNQLGTFMLVASYKDKEYRKEIDVVPVW